MRRAVLYCIVHCIALLPVVRDAIDLLWRVALTFEFFSCSFQPAACPDATSNTDTAIDPTNACEYIPPVPVLHSAMWLLPPLYIYIPFSSSFFPLRRRLVFFFFFFAKACREKQDEEEFEAFESFPSLLSRGGDPRSFLLLSFFFFFASLWFTSHRRVNANILPGF